MSKEVVKCKLLKEKVITEKSEAAKALFDNSCYGTFKDEKVYLSLPEAMYLLERDRIEILDSKNKPISKENFEKKASRVQKNFATRYSVFKDLRDRGYIVKTALKFGADFRVYDRGIKPGQDHAKWVVFPVHETSSFTWHEFSAKNRVAHSTKKRLLLGIVDDELDVTYYEIAWKRP